MNRLAGERHTLGQWKWLADLGIPTRRGPVMGDSAEDIGGFKAEEEEEGLPDCSEGEGGRDLIIADTTKEPRLVVE